MPRQELSIGIHIIKYSSKYLLVKVQDHLEYPLMKLLFLAIQEVFKYKIDFRFAFSVVPIQDLTENIQNM